MYPAVVISDRARRRVRGKYPWVFSNEITSKPEGALPGELIEIHDRAGKFLGLGYYNPHTLIAVRILSHHQSFDIAERIQTAFKLRKSFYSDSVYRLIYSESDGLPGLIADRYNETIVAELLTAGMEKLRQPVIESLLKVPGIERILLRNDSHYRKLENLPLDVEWVAGSPVEKQIIQIDDLKFSVDLTRGQKTGFFLDQRENRQRLSTFVRGGNMLDAFSYTGAWAIYGAKAGMESVTAIDSSHEALEIATRNAELNGYSITTVAADAIDFLRERYPSGDRFDLIVLDPPAFCRSRKQLAQAVKGYREINLRAMKLLKNNGLLFSCSCSQPLTPDLFLEVLRQAAADSGRTIQLRELRLHPHDHPVLLNFPESLYLKCAILQVTSNN